MRKTIIATLLSVAVVACSSSDLSIAPAAGVLNKPAVGKEDQSIIYQLSSDETLNVHIQKIEESRCPSDVQCISAGFVKVSFHIQGVGDTELITPNFAGSNASDTFEFTSGSQSFRLILKDVIPFPTTKNYDEPKSVEFVLEQL